MPAQIQKGDIFVDGQTVTASRLNNLVDLAIALKGIIGEQAAVVAATTDYILITDSSDSGNLKRALISSLPGAGTVTSVAMTATPTTVFLVNVTNATTTPAIALTLKNQGPGSVLAGPATGPANGQPTFRALVPADLPVGTVAPLAMDIDWSLGNTFTKTLTANAIFTFSNPSNGQTIRVRVVQDVAPGLRTVAWPSSVRWPNGTDPVMTTGAQNTDIYTFTYIVPGGLFYGTFNQKFLP